MAGAHWSGAPSVLLVQTNLPAARKGEPLGQMVPRRCTSGRAWTIVAAATPRPHWWGNTNSPALETPSGAALSHQWMTDRQCRGRPSWARLRRTLVYSASPGGPAARQSPRRDAPTAIVFCRRISLSFPAHDASPPHCYAEGHSRPSPLPEIVANAGPGSLLKTGRRRSLRRHAARAIEAELNARFARLRRAE